MTNTKRGSTQSFTEIENIVEDVVFLSSGNACLIIKVEASNFTLLSQQEQDAKIAAYATLLNSLSFSIQIVVRNKQIDLTSYLALLDDAGKKQQNGKLRQHIQMYREFVSTLATQTTVLDKTFCIVVPYSSLEQGFGITSSKGSFAQAAQAALRAKAETLLSQLSRIGLRSRILSQQELVKLAYASYNEGHEGALRIGEGISAPIVKGS